MRLFKVQALLIMVVFCADGAAQANWVTLDFPGATSTRARGVDGDNIVGSYRDSSSNRHGFLYDGTSYTSLDFPGAPSTDAYGIDGRSIVDALLGAYTVFSMTEKPGPHSCTRAPFVRTWSASTVIR